MRLQMEMAEKLADGFSPHAAFEAKHKQSGHDQADEPVSACLGFPQRRLRIAVAAVHRLEVTMHTAFGKSGVLRKASDALLPVFTNRVENDQALGPQSHSGGPCSEGWLTWCLKSALQSTRSTTHCPALETWPGFSIQLSDNGVLRSFMAKAMHFCQGLSSQLLSFFLGYISSVTMIFTLMAVLVTGRL